MNYFEGYRCAACGREVPAGSAAAECPSCDGPLLAVYDFGLMRRSARERKKAITRSPFPKLQHEKICNWGLS